jgi:tRNA1Val (adenine37-N6)-methyltransferase
VANSYFKFKQFTIRQDRSNFKVGTDGVLLGACADVSGKRYVLDIGTGTGLIALMVAQRCDALIMAIEPDIDSYSQAIENVNQSKWAKNIVVENCKLQDFNSVQKFDLIITNPPFFIRSLKNPDPLKSYARHNDSLTHADLMTGANRLLEEDGIIQLILPYEEGSVFIAEAHEYGFYCNSILKVRPLPDSEIKRLILGFSRKKMKTAERFLTIEKNKRYEFTQEYINLTKEFYLKF